MWSTSALHWESIDLSFTYIGLVVAKLLRFIDLHHVREGTYGVWWCGPLRDCISSLLIFHLHTLAQ